MAVVIPRAVRATESQLVVAEFRPRSGSGGGSRLNVVGLTGRHVELDPAVQVAGAVVIEGEQTAFAVKHCHEAVQRGSGCGILFNRHAPGSWRDEAVEVHVAGRFEGPRE